MRLPLCSEPAFQSVTTTTSPSDGVICVSSVPAPSWMATVVGDNVTPGLTSARAALTLNWAGPTENDDVVGAIPVHLVAGIWGTAAVVISNPEAVLWVQLAGAAGIGAFAFATSIIIWTVLRRTIGIRLKRHHENAGGDMVEVGMRAYNIV